MEPAKSIVRRLGGAEEVANYLGVHRTRVYAWGRSKSKGGSDGLIPNWHIPKLIAMAAKKKVPLEAEDFFTQQKERGAA